MKRFISLIFGCLVTSVLTFGQSSRDLKIIEQKHFQTQKMFEAINKANTLLNEQPEEALGEVEKALKLSYHNKNKRG